MKHRIHKFKFNSGIGANRMLLRKLVYNFIKSGKMVTTEKRGKALKTYLETVVHKSRTDTTSNRNYLLKKLGSQAVIKTLYSEIAPATSERKSGFVTLRRLHARLSDGAPMVEIKWSMPIVKVESIAPSKPEKQISDAKKPALTKSAKKTKGA